MNSDELIPHDYTILRRSIGNKAVGLLKVLNWVVVENGIFAVNTKKRHGNRRELCKILAGLIYGKDSCC